jgi:hypothetical protein
VNAALGGSREMSNNEMEMQKKISAFAAVALVTNAEYHHSQLSSREKKVKLL